MSDVKEQLLEAAQKTFARFGYKKTTLDDIVKVFGKGKTSIYYYYQGKDDIYKASLEKEVNDMLTAIVDETGKGVTPVDQLKRYVTARMKRVADSPVLFAAAASEQIRNLPFVNIVLADLDKRRHEKLHSIIESGMQHGAFKKLDAQVMTVAIETALKGMESYFVEGSEPVNVDQRIDNMLNLLLYGLAEQA